MKQDDQTAQLLEEIRRTVVEYDVKGVEVAVEKALNAGVYPTDILENGLSIGIKEIGKQFGDGSIFLPELIRGSKAMQEGVNLLKAHWENMASERKVLGKVIIGTVKGDVHSIGKQIVSSLLNAGGFELFDIGEDVPIETFIDEVKKIKPDIIGLSALLTTTLPQQRYVIRGLKEAGLRDKVKVMIGGAPTTEDWAMEIGADGWAPNAGLAVKEAKKLLKVV